MSSKVNEFDGFIVVYYAWGHFPNIGYCKSYDEALRRIPALKYTKEPYEKAIACILNHRMEVVYKTEVDPDA